MIKRILFLLLTVCVVAGAQTQFPDKRVLSLNVSFSDAWGAALTVMVQEGFAIDMRERESGLLIYHYPSTASSTHALMKLKFKATGTSVDIEERISTNFWEYFEKHFEPLLKEELGIK
jgi:hypothetical protein